MKYKYLFFSLTIGLFLYGCTGGSPGRNIELNIVFCNQVTAAPGNHFPKDLLDISMPIEGVCKPSANLIFYPLTAKRVDVNKETSFDYENNKASNYDKVKAVIRDLKKYFKDSVISASLSVQTNNNFNLEGFLSENSNKENYLIFSDDEKLPPGPKRYDNITDLRKAIAQLICDKNLSKIVVLYKPTSAAADARPIEKTDTNVYASTQTQMVVKKPVTTIVAHPVRPHATGLESDLEKLAGPNLNAEEKEVLKNRILNSFAGDAKVYKNNNNQVTGVNEIHNYLENLIVTPSNVVKKIKVDSTKKFNGKIYDLYVQETYIHEDK